MKDLLLHNSYKDVTLTISQCLIDDITKEIFVHLPKEFGGFLFGKYSESKKHLHILKQCIPNFYISSKAGFERYTDGIVDFYDHKDTGTDYYYVGEWHSHPYGNTMFSLQDLNAMRRIEAFQSVSIQNPVLLILSTNSQKEINYKFYLYHNGGLTAYEQN